MWFSALMGGFVSILLFITYLVGKHHGRKECMIENGILFGKDAERFLERMKEAENKEPDATKLFEKLAKIGHQREWKDDKRTCGEIMEDEMDKI